jgi:hypothetical protein
MVTNIPPGSRPGMSNLAMAPTIRPTTSIQTIDIGFYRSG